MTSKCNRKNRQRKLFIVLIKSLLIFMISLVVGWGLVPLVIKEIAAKLITITPGLEFYHRVWIHPPVPIYFKVNLFNVTNPGEVEAGQKPIFREMGPYVFDEIRYKNNVTLDDEKDTATYMEHVLYKFRPDLSGDLHLSDVVTILNVPFAAAAIKLNRDLPWPINHVALMIILNFKESLFVQKTVQEILFDGWKVSFLEEIEEEIGMTFLPNNTFAYFMGWNDTNQGPFTVQRGSRGDPRLVSNTIAYKNESSWMVWGEQNSRCNKIRGTNAFVNPPFNTKETKLTVYDINACGALDLIYKHDNVEIEGIRGYHYHIPQSEMTSARRNPQNECFCKYMAKKQPEKCYGDGVLDLGPCRNGDPVALSMPHFLYADPTFLNSVGGGLNPDPEKHSCFVEMEPFTGLVIRASKRFQINLILKPVSGIPSLRKVPEMFFPLFWSDQGAVINTEMADHLKGYLFLIPAGEKGSQLVCILVATFFTALLLRNYQDSVKGVCKSCDGHKIKKTKKTVIFEQVVPQEETNEEGSDLIIKEES